MGHILPQPLKLVHGLFKTSAVIAAYPPRYRVHGVYIASSDIGPVILGAKEVDTSHKNGGLYKPLPKQIYLHLAFALQQIFHRHADFSYAAEPRAYLATVKIICGQLVSRVG